MSWLILLIGLGLGVLWIIALGTAGAAAGWFTWLVFVAACALLLIAFVNMGVMKRNTGKPI